MNALTVFLLLFFFAFRYSATKVNAHEKHQPNWDHDNTLAEAIWWATPTVIVIFLSVIAWQSTHRLDPFVKIPSNAPGITIEVVALPWKWLFIYPELGIATVNEIAFPENTPITFKITSDAPMNSFWIPSLGGQIMAMQGMVTELNLLAEKTGVHNGLSGNISGEGFSGMTFKVHSMEPFEFSAWVEKVKASTNALTFSSYKRIAEPSSYNAVAYFYPVSPLLYTDIVMKYMSHAPTENGQKPSLPMNH